MISVELRRSQLLVTVSALSLLRAHYLSTKMRESERSMAVSGVDEILAIVKEAEQRAKEAT